MRLDHCQLHEEEKDELHSLAEDAAVHIIYSEVTTDSLKSMIGKVFSESSV